jgi:hypothetical protein
MTMYRSLCCILVAIFVFSWSFASSPSAGELFIGEVLKADATANKVTVKKPDGNRFTFAVDEKTRFDGTRKSLKELTPGDRVTVEFQVTGGQYKALKIATP